MIASLRRCCAPVTVPPPSCGAAAAERELRKFGDHVYRRTRAGKTNEPGIESLTERELQVARLVVDRKTNAEIAAKLFLSKKRSRRPSATSSAGSASHRESS